MFSYNFGMEHLMVQSVFNEHQCMFINFHLFSVEQCVSLIFYESSSYLMIFCASMNDIEMMKRSVFIQFWYVEFNGAICFNEHQCMIINFIFSVLMSVSLLIHERYSYLMILCANMSDIKIIKRSAFIHFWYGEFNGAICF